MSHVFVSQLQQEEISISSRAAIDVSRLLWQEEWKWNDIPVNSFLAICQKREKHWKESVGNTFPERKFIELIFSICLQEKLLPMTKYGAIAIFQAYLKRGKENARFSMSNRSK